MAAEASASVSPVLPEPALTPQPHASTSGATPAAEMSQDSVVSVRKTRTLILCFDGTSNQYDQENTNVVRFYSVLDKSSEDEQLCYYQPGIGTYFQPGVVQPIFQWGAKILDEAVAWYLDAHVQGGYTFLMQNYCVGDKICIFGFSRGAYTARALAGMLHKIGLLPKDNPEQVPLAYKLYQSASKNSRALAAGFKRTFCRSVAIDFVGVWDTVASVGLLRSKTLPFTTTNTTIRVFRHALALDERRAKFQPNLYHRLTLDASATVADVLARQPDDPPPTPDKRLGKEVVASPVTEEALLHATPEQEQGPKRGWIRKLFSRATKGKGNPLRGDNVVDPAADPGNDDGISQTDVREVWFVGAHSDVGGGSVPNDTPASLADISLRWMVRQVEEAQCGIKFDSHALGALNIPEPLFAPTPAPLAIRTAEPAVVTTAGGRAHGQKQLEAFGYGRASAESDAMRASEDSADSADTRASSRSAVDALQPVHDELKLDWWWWLLEVVPTNYTYQDVRGVWHSKWSLHLGRGRCIPSARPLFHVTVRERMEDRALGYRPKARWREGEEEYVE